MILVDTNVISEPWRPAPDPCAPAWIDAQAIETLYLSTITVAELRFGIAVLPAANGARPSTTAWSGTYCPCSRGASCPSTWLPHKPIPT